MASQLSFSDLLDGSFSLSDETDWEFMRGVAQNLFNPKRPIDDAKLLSGRLEQIEQVVDTVYEQGGHGIIFGERGVGKTSLAKTIETRIAPVLGDVRVPEPISCGSGDDFFTIWGNAFREYNIGGEDPISFFRSRVNPYDVYDCIEKLPPSCYHVLIFDEFDRIKDQKTLEHMADLLKHYSNNPKNMTVIIVGVGDTLIDLFGAHESIARCCEQIKMPRMSEPELREILEGRLSRVRFDIEPQIVHRVIKLSQGLPGYIHLLGRLMLISAIERRSTKIEERDFNVALSQVLEKADHETRNDYYKAVSSSSSDNKYKEVLLACAMAESNELGYFFAGSVREPYSQIRRKQMDIPHFSTNLKNLCDESRGPALIKTGPKKRYRYRFSNPLLQPLTIMLGVRDGLIRL